MEAEKANFPVKTMARLLSVSRSGYYAWLARSGSDPWEEARGAVERAWLASRGRLGARCVRAKLAAEGMGLTLYLFLIAFIFRKSRDKSFGFHDDCFAS